MQYKNGVSVIIPTFNRASYLYTTLLLLLNQQTSGNFQYEILVIDSGSDDTDKLVSFFNARKPGIITYLRIKNCSNRSLLRNTGAEASQYEILVFLDNDILVPQDFIQRQYDSHKEKEHFVVMGYRKNLVSFEIAQIGEEALIKDFTILDLLPSYRDERLKQDISVQPWRFVFSHTLSMSSSDFFSAGEFNIEFGEHWGLEDLELGVKLMNLGCKFELTKNMFTYHQPHFTQSNKDQHEKSYNGNLFIKLHDCFECELYESFYTSFESYYPELKTLKDKFSLPDTSLQKKYDFIFCCLFSIEEQTPFTNMQLGTFCILPDKSCSNVLILNTFFDLQEVIQMSVLSEAFRVSDKVHFEDCDEKQIQIVENKALKAGLLINYSKETTSVCFTKKADVNSDIFLFLLPDIFTPEKRYIYVWLADFLLKNGIYVNLRDLKGADSFLQDDFCLSEDENITLAKNINKCFGKTKLQFINSLSLLLVEQGVDIPNDSKNYIFHDDDYILKYESLKYRNYSASNHLDGTAFCALTFLSVYDECRSVIDIRKKTTVRENTFCCFMENGFLEDGIDIILPAFAEYANTHPDAKLSIKMPCYEKLYTTVYPYHNSNSKLNKLFPARTKYQLDFYEMQDLAVRLGIKNNVEIISQNPPVSEILNFINSSETLIFASRGCFVPPQVYASVILGKRTVIAAHHVILRPFTAYCTVIGADLFPFPEEMGVPSSCLNTVFQAGRIRKTELAAGLHREYKGIDDKTVKEMYRQCSLLVKNTFVEGKKEIRPSRAGSR